MYCHRFRLNISALNQNFPRTASIRPRLFLSISIILKVLFDQSERESERSKPNFSWIYNKVFHWWYNCISENDLLKSKRQVNGRSNNGLLFRRLNPWNLPLKYKLLRCQAFPTLNKQDYDCGLSRQFHRENIQYWAFRREKIKKFSNFPCMTNCTVHLLTLS